MTDRAQLDARNAAVIRRHWRALADAGGQPPQQLLDELAAIAEYHAGGRTGEVLNALGEQETQPAQPLGGEPGPAAAKAAPRRTPPRRAAK